MSHHEDEKKKKIRERNKRNWMIFTLSEQQREKVDVAAPVNRKTGEKEAKKSTESIEMHMHSIRNRITGGRRKSEDRWNRFAGTSGGGGRGR